MNRLRIKQVDGQWAVVHRAEGQDWVMEFFSSEEEAKASLEEDREVSRFAEEMFISSPVREGEDED